MNQRELIEGIHFYINRDGYIVLTEKYLLEKGFCCGMGCLHCPYNYENVPEPGKSELLFLRTKKENQ
ncbi:MAG TPA: DUF5522 domain-containing protein [Chitinophagaceae bacterium]|nr:DUF5522 domain-containing protein [Chitinophagaceae bacterium]